MGLGKDRIMLRHGSLLLMMRQSQVHFLHSVPKVIGPKTIGVRFNIMCRHHCPEKTKTSTLGTKKSITKRNKTTFDAVDEDEKDEKDETKTTQPQKRTRAENTKKYTRHFDSLNPFAPP